MRVLELSNDRRGSRRGYPSDLADTGEIPEARAGRCGTMLGMPIRVLIVDDHAEFRTAARELLLDAGYAVSGEAATAAEALAAVSHLSPDVVLLDVQLPDGDGIELASALARDGGRPVVVLVSTRDAQDYGSRLAGCGARGFVSKSRLSASTLARVLQ